MKKYYVFLLLFALLANVCGCSDDVAVLPSKSVDLHIKGRVIWSDDLLKFVTPVLYYVDAEDVHRIVVSDTMMVDEIWELNGESFDFFSQSWDYDINYAYIYTKADTVCLKLKYIEKEYIEIVDTETYTFNHQLNVSNVVMSYVNEDGSIVIPKFSALGGEERSEEIKCRGSEVRRFIDSLLIHPLERKIYLRDGNIEVE